MNEVEKMYENCNIKPKQKGYCDWDSNCPYPHHKCNDECPYWKYEDEAKYPPFTAEKQLELIKWLSKGKNGFGVFNDGTEGLSCHCDFNWEWFNKDFYAEDFDNALSGLINTLWQDLTEEERKQIKEILE